MKCCSHWCAGAPRCSQRIRGVDRAELPLQRARRARQGFTLIELMVVLVLIGILSAMIVSEMKGTYADALLRSSGRDLVNAFKLAYSQAVSQNQVHIVRLDEKGRHFLVARQVKGRGNHVEFEPLKDNAGSSGNLDERITMEVHKSDDAVTESQSDQDSQPPPEAANKLENVLTFYPDGTADAADVVLRDAAGVGLRLRIDPITARVEVLELEEEQP